MALPQTRDSTPIAKLPVELLSHIFLLCAHTPNPAPGSEAGSNDENEQGNEISPCLSSGTSPDVFAAVNKHWREVATGTPQLWTRICVTIGDVIYHRAGSLFAAVSRYASRSGRCPLDVFIDARDPDWDFSESDSYGAVISPYIDEVYDYAHPFKVEHMHHVLNILVPHVHRFRSLAILTDRWAPMQTALDCLSMQIPAFVSTPRPLPKSLPFLETLVLMRCNEFVSYNSEFSPVDSKDAAHLPFGALLPIFASAESNTPVLPRLKKLVLSGVHTQWAALPRLLPSQGSAMETLDLSYHCKDVRPSERDFKALLERCPGLRTLNIRVTGPRSPDSPQTSGSAVGEEPVSLPHLETMVVAYDDAYSAATLVDMLDAPHLRHLALEEATSPGRERNLDASPLLRACTVKSVRSDSGSDAGSRSSSSSCPFPQLETLALRDIDGPAQTFAAMFEALSSMRELSVAQMFLLGGQAIRPEVRVTFEVPVGYTPVWRKPGNDDESRELVPRKPGSSSMKEWYVWERPDQSASSTVGAGSASTRQW